MAWLRIFPGLACASLLSGCLAQQADLNAMERSLSGKITKLDQEEKQLQEAIKQARQDVDRLVSETRARMSQEITVLREEDVPSIRGAVDKQANQLMSLRARLEDLEARAAKAVSSLAAADDQRKAAVEQGKAQREELQREIAKLNARLDAMPGTIGTMVKTLGTRLDEHEQTIKAGDARSTAVSEQLQTQGRTVSEQIGQLGRALAEFKQALQGLSDKVARDDQAEQARSTRLSQRLDALQTKVETDAKATSGYLAEVNRSVASVATAVETMGGRVATRMDEQDKRFEQVVGAVQAVTTQVNTLTDAINHLQAAAPQSAAEPGTGPEGESALKPSTNPSPEASVKPQSAAVATMPQVGAVSQEHARARYEANLKKLKEGDLDAAQRGFSEFLATYPDSTLAGNAQYWLGECYYGKKDYARAIDAFTRVSAQHPDSGKAAAALLKKGFAYLALNDSKQAAVVLRQVVETYPRTPEAEKASQKLAQLGGR